MNKITYIFGAGASCNALPLVVDMPNRINRFLKLMESEEFVLDDKTTYEDLNLENPKSKREYQIELINSVKWLINECKPFGSIDELASNLADNFRISDLKKLKIALSIYFVFEQAANKYDSRYDVFFRSLLNGCALHESIKVISWNYDYQFELAYKKYQFSEDIHHIQMLLGIVEKYCGIAYDDESKKKIFKINGTASFHSNSSMNKFFITRDINGPVNKDFIERLIWSYVIAMYLNDRTSSLSFAWENDNDQIVDQIIEQTKDTDILVIIGYSFPIPNYEIDKNIIDKMSKLKKVYFQAPNADTLIERFKSMRNDINKIELIKQFDVQEFLILV